MPTSSILSEIEWDEGFSMPVANVENRKLESLVTEKEKAIVKNQQELRLNEDRVHHISEHLKNVRQELKHTQVTWRCRCSSVFCCNVIAFITSRV